MKIRTEHRFGFGAAALAGLLFAVPASAGGDHKAMEKMDTSGDGQVSRDEYAAAKKTKFETMDADKNGTVTAQEMETAYVQFEGKDAKKAKGHMTVAERFKMADTNGDGTINAAEYSTSVTMSFDKMDTNKDGSLSKAELEAGHKAMEKKANEAAKEATK